MFTWKEYYVEYERRQSQIDEARQYRLKKVFQNLKGSRLRKSSFRIQPKHFAHNHEISYELK
jgi:hypothetical protein